MQRRIRHAEFDGAQLQLQSVIVSERRPRRTINITQICESDLSLWLLSQSHLFEEGAEGGVKETKGERRRQNHYAADL